MQSVGPYLPNQKKLDYPLISQAESSFQNLYLFGLRVYHIQPMLDRRVVEILTNLYREIGHRHWRLGPLRFPCYSERPNIGGQGGTVLSSYAPTLCFSVSTKNNSDVAFMNGDYSSYDLALSADQNTSVYGNSDTVQPAALRGYWLIRF